MKSDKLTWVVMIVCGGLLALNFYYSSKNKQALAVQEAERKAAIEAVQTTEGGTLSAEVAQETTEQATIPEKLVTLSSPKANFEFNTREGGIRYVEFLEEHEVNQPDVPVKLNRYGKDSIGSLFDRNFVLQDQGYIVQSQTADSITFLGKLQNGLVVLKEWKKVADDAVGSEYRWQLTITIENPTSETRELGNLAIYAGGATPLYKSEMRDLSGFFYLKEGNYKKKNESAFKKNSFVNGVSTLEKTAKGFGFAGVYNQFFTSSLKPSAEYDATIIARAAKVELPEEAGGGEKKEFEVAATLPQEILAPNGGKKVIQYELYAGPKKYQVLKKLDERKKLMYEGNIVNPFGLISWLSGILNTTLNFLHDTIFGKLSDNWSWGLAIIALTLVIRSFMWPLHAQSTRSMKRMSKLQPKLKELKEKYPDDPNKMNQEMMKLYGEYGINPVGGCLPMFAQIPIFFGLFSMLKSAIEFRHEKFLWIDDLSQPDTIFSIPLPFEIPVFGASLPINLLPLFMFGTTMLQMSMNPTVADPNQKMIMRLMPIMMVVFCYNFAAALALYWTTSNIFTIFQTWLMKKMPEPELKKKKGPKKGGFAERMQKQAEEMQRMKDAKKRGENPAAMRDAKPKKKRGPRTGG